jgi:hypothetical protein
VEVRRVEGEASYKILLRDEQENNGLDDLRAADGSECGDG